MSKRPESVKIIEKEEQPEQIIAAHVNAATLEKQAAEITDAFLSEPYHETPLQATSQEQSLKQEISPSEK